MDVPSNLPLHHPVAPTLRLNLPLLHYNLSAGGGRARREEQGRGRRCLGREAAAANFAHATRNEEARDFGPARHETAARFADGAAEDFLQGSEAAVGRGLGQRREVFRVHDANRSAQTRSRRRFGIRHDVGSEEGPGRIASARVRGESGSTVAQRPADDLGASAAEHKQSNSDAAAAKSKQSRGTAKSQPPERKKKHECERPAISPSKWYLAHVGALMTPRDELLRELHEYLKSATRFEFITFDVVWNLRTSGETRASACVALGGLNLFSQGVGLMQMQDAADVRGRSAAVRALLRKGSLWNMAPLSSAAECAVLSHARVKAVLRATVGKDAAPRLPRQPQDSLRVTATRVFQQACRALLETLIRELIVAASLRERRNIDPKTALNWYNAFASDRDKNHVGAARMLVLPTAKTHGRCGAARKEELEEDEDEDDEYDGKDDGQKISCLHLGNKKFASWAKEIWAQEAFTQRESAIGLTGGAVLVLQAAVEAYLARLCAAAAEACGHRSGRTLAARDVRLVLKVMRT